MSDASELWPPLNALAWLRLPCCGAEHPTRVEDVDGDFVTVAAPVAPHTDLVRPLGPEEGFFLGWVMDRGAMEVPVALKAHELEPIPTWRLHQIGDPTETQRRKFVRLDIQVETKVGFRSGAPAEVITTGDLSEGGMRFHVTKWVADPGGEPLPVSLQLGEKTLELTGQVAWWGDLDAGETRSVGLRFVGIMPSEADAIRSFVFAAQIERRRRTQ